MPPTLHLWTPGLFDFKGGIQTYSGFLLEGLQAVLPTARIRVFTLHDRSATLPPAASPQISYHTTGNFHPRLRTAAFAAQTFQAALADRPDLIITTHVNFTPVAQALKQLAGLSYWAIAHGFEAWEVEKPPVRRGMAKADQILAVSGFTRDRIRQSQGLTNLGVLPNTFDADRFQVLAKPTHLLQRYGLRPDQPVILTVNRLAAGEPFHSYDQILAALPAIRRVLPDVHYLVVGKGDDRPRLEQLIAERHLQDCVTLAGFVPDTDLPDHYALCDVFAMPSQLEGFGIVYLEAMACGKPVLAGFDGGQDALQHGDLGALVDPEAIDAIAETLIVMLTGQYPNPLIYQPQALRQSAIAAFGPQAFQRGLTRHLVNQFSAELVPSLPTLHPSLP
ncbi:glycosyltransferase [Nodosilinea sp. E11]|uniref:glycosyltransferase n=1 Tax=Nodosilinea sp. E11 TaxID=3037479 RepID=UPI00293496AD|nr:glycosyltransferase [Nodosilinea sp. E11]WOD41514.1 glycosyltransferase [Nodosilinea sp. E11]